uniref:Putative Ty3-gypsy-like retroelement Pol polyprotein n=1 Tax=Tanacetum cinerariifolium TaxID=118510 RepID=A0A6L2NKJ4_TANCI|nr:putative Ty3-gypsy-like retroelement Pol polyprotein [Tanacetum cinerariifolium]
MDLVDLSNKKNIQTNIMVEEVQATHDRAKIDESNSKYKAGADKYCGVNLFSEGDEVMVFLPNEHFLVSTYSKFQQKKYGPYQVLRTINDNDYVVGLPNTMSISKTFNVLDIYEFHPEKEIEDEKLRSSASKMRENDEDKIKKGCVVFWERYNGGNLSSRVEEKLG